MIDTIFNLQMFGDNDTITSSRTVDIEFGFIDGDTRTVKIPNPKINLDSSTVAALSTWTESKNILLGDKTFASSTGINSATITETTKRNLDIS